MTGWRPPLALVVAWLALLALLALTVTLAYVPLGAFNAVVALTIGTSQGRGRGGYLYGAAGPRSPHLCLCRRRIVLARHSAVARDDGFPDADLTVSSSAPSPQYALSARRFR